MYPQNAQKVSQNQTVLNNLTSELYSIDGNEKIPNDCRYPIFVTQARQSKKDRRLSKASSAEH